jgi:hypothetical protein
MSLVTAQAINSYIVLHIWLGFVSSSLIVVVIIYACFIHNRTGDATVRGVKHAACVSSSASHRQDPCLHVTYSSYSSSCSSPFPINS